MTNDNNQRTALAVRDTQPITIVEQAEYLLSSGFLPPTLNTVAKIVAVVLRGRELGIGAMEACLSLNIIQGRVTSSTQLMLSLIYRSGLLEDIEMVRGDPAKCMMKRKGMTAHTVTFGTKDAQRMGLMAKDNYKKQPETMFLWRAIAICARVVFPDKVSAVYTPDELGMEINSDNETRQGDWEVIEPVTLTAEQTTRAQQLKAEGKRAPAIARELNIDVSALLEAMPDLV